LLFLALKTCQERERKGEGERRICGGGAKEKKDETRAQRPWQCASDDEWRARFGVLIVSASFWRHVCANMLSSKMTYRYRIATDCQRRIRQYPATYVHRHNSLNIHTRKIIVARYDSQ